jgi:hypothetical protein
MRAFVITGPRQTAVADVARLRPHPARPSLTSSWPAPSTRWPARWRSRAAARCAVQAAALGQGGRVLVLGPGTVGLLATRFALASRAEVHVLAQTPESAGFAATLGVHSAWTAGSLPALPFDAVIDCSNAPELPALALDLVEPGKRIVCVGLADRPSLIDTRAMVLKDVTAVGILGGSHALAGAIEQYAAGKVDPRPLVAATVGLGDVGSVLAGTRPPGSGPGRKSSSTRAAEAAGAVMVSGGRRARGWSGYHPKSGI